MKNRNHKHITTKNTKGNQGNRTKTANGVPYITDKQHYSTERALLKMISMYKQFFGGQMTPVLQHYLTTELLYMTKVSDPFTVVLTDQNTIRDCLKVVSNSIVDTNNSFQHGSAMFPLYNNVWNIGAFGSIWLDIIVNGKKYRVCFYNETPKLLTIIEH